MTKPIRTEPKPPPEEPNYSCGNCHAKIPCGCTDPAIICDICGGDEYDCNCDERSYEPQKRTVAISRDGVTTIFDAAWLDIMRTQDDGSMYGNNTQG